MTAWTHLGTLWCAVDCAANTITNDGVCGESPRWIPLGDRQRWWCVYAFDRFRCDHGIVCLTPLVVDVKTAPRIPHQSQTCQTRLLLAGQPTILFLFARDLDRCWKQQLQQQFAPNHDYGTCKFFVSRGVAQFYESSLVLQITSILLSRGISYLTHVIRVSTL